MSRPRKKKRPAKRALALPDLEQSKAAVLNTLTSKSGQRSYDRAITDFVAWYCSEPRLAFSRTVVLRYRILLEQKPYAVPRLQAEIALCRQRPNGHRTGQSAAFAGAARMRTAPRRVAWPSG